MPKEESLYKEKPKFEFQTKTQEDLTENQNLSVVQNQITGNVQGTTNQASVIPVIGADQFAQVPEQEVPQVSVDFSVKGNIILDDDSSRMRSLKNSVASFYSLQEILNRRGEKNLEREKNLDDLMKQAEDIISKCKWYCFFRQLLLIYRL